MLRRTTPLTADGVRFSLSILSMPRCVVCGIVETVQDADRVPEICLWGVLLPHVAVPDGAWSFGELGQRVQQRVEVERRDGGVREGRGLERQQLRLMEEGRRECRTSEGLVRLHGANQQLGHLERKVAAENEGRHRLRVRACERRPSGS